MTKIEQKTKRLICSIVFVIYIVALLYITVFRFGVHYEDRQLNLTPFRELARVYRDAATGRFLRLFLGNIGWFMPLGFLLPICIKQQAGDAVLTSSA